MNCGQISPIASKVVEHRDASEKHILAHAKCKFVCVCAYSIGES